jgi:hypothetical protein
MTAFFCSQTSLDVGYGYDFGQKAMTVGSADDMLKGNKQYQHHEREQEIYTHFLCAREEISKRKTG